MEKEQHSASPLDITVVRQRDRNAMSRYDYPEDRKDFSLWRRAPGPSRSPYWHYEELRGRLTIELRKGDSVMCYDVTEIELERAWLGWRWLVAQAVRQVRRALTHNVELTGADRRPG